MWEMAWPIGLAVLSTVAYNVASKLVPSGVNPLVSIVVTYLVAAAFALVLYLAIGGRDLVGEVRSLNGATLLMAFAVVGVDASVILAFRAGWGVSQEPVVQSAISTVVLMALGVLLFKEAVGARQVMGVVACLVGLALIMA